MKKLCVECASTSAIVERLYACQKQLIAHSYSSQKCHFYITPFVENIIVVKSIEE